MVTPNPTKFNALNTRFGKLVAVEFVGIDAKSKRAMWRCKCDCGNEVVVAGTILNKGKKRSCGCLISEVNRRSKTKHGQFGTPTYRSWCSMKDRCSKENHHAYKNYGGRGISVCERWANSFANFLCDMGERPSLEHSIDRIDNNGNYEPGNCRWATKTEQVRNTRVSRFATLNGRTQTLIEWAEELGIPYSCLCERHRQGWDDERMLTTPIQIHVRPR